MRTAITSVSIAICVLCLLIPPAVAGGKGYMGGMGTVVVEEEPTPTEEPTTDGGIPDTVEGPLNDMMADSGKLFGDLYKILRQQGVAGDQKLVPMVDEFGVPVLGEATEFTYTIDGTEYTYLVSFQLFETVENVSTLDAVVGGEPVLTVIDPGAYNTFQDYGWYAAEIGTYTVEVDGVETEVSVYGAAQSPYPAQCVQPVADYARWGDISSKTGLTKNRLPLVVTYDATWNRSECEVNQLTEPPEADPYTGELTIPVNIYFVEPCDKDDGGNPIPADKCQWWDTNNGLVTYPDGVLWADLIGEVHFGRLNISRSPEAVMQSAFDEAVNTINSPDTVAIEIDAAGRLLLTKNVYDPLLVDTATGLPILIGTVKKAIDSPLENVGLYVKLMKDGHLVTPGDERAPIDRSKNGGIPLWKMLELEDGPADAALRPTINIAKLRDFGLGDLVDVTETSYLTYYVCLNDAGAEVPCLIWDEDPVQPEIDRELVGNPAAVSRKLVTVLESAGCPDSYDVDNPYVCEGPFTGIMTDDGGAPGDGDLNFTAGFIAAAADKTGHMSVDMIVYLNSILGINQVLGYSEYDAVTGEPTADAVDYEKHPVYFNYRGVFGYDRDTVFNNRGQVATPSDEAGTAATYDGNVTVLQNSATSPTTWNETVVGIMNAQMVGKTIFDNIGLDLDTAFPNGDTAADNILGFTQLSDDNLSVIRFIHTYQIPGLR